MHHKGIEEVLRELRTDESGLTQAEAARRLSLYGPAEIEAERESPLRLLIRQFVHPLVLVLVVSSLMALSLGDWHDSVVIWGIVFFNGLVGFYQEVKAQKGIQALRALTRAQVKVLREGTLKEVDSYLIVPGDVVVLKEGDVVPADLRLIEAKGLLVDESFLTGESFPVDKNSEIILPEDTPIYERRNVLFKGAVIVRGKAKGVVFATGAKTQMGRVAEKIKEPSATSPLIRALWSFSQRWVLVLIVILSLLVVLGILQGRDWKFLLFLGVSLLVSAVPEGLPIVVTISLVLGAIYLTKRKVLVRYLAAIETLGSATFICSDKTGTITEGRLKVADSHALDERALWTCSVLCNDSDGVGGDPLDLALLRWVEGLGIAWRELRKRKPKVWEHPFDTKLRLMAVIVPGEKGYEVYVKGAFESLQERATHLPQSLKEVHDRMAEKGLRVLAFGRASVDKIPSQVEELKVELVGLIGFLDPPKEEAKEAILQAKRAGIRVIMITGDNLLTAKGVGRLVGLYQDGEDLAIEGKDLAKFEDEELYQLLKKVTIVARALPEDKYRIVKVLQARGEIVAVTGDGVNDAPALKVAHLGVAMGTGSQVAKDSSAIIILDNNLSIILQAIIMGRHINKNIAKVIKYLLSANFAQLIYTSLTVLFGLPIPLYPTQILWINLVTDGAQDKTYPLNRFEGDPFKDKPKKPQELFFNKRQILQVLYNGLIVALSNFFLFLYSLKHFPYEVTLTLSFTSVVMAQWSVGLQEISEKPFFLNPLRHLKTNPYIYLGVILGSLLQALALYALPEFFHVVSPSLKELSYPLAVAGITFLAIELRKWGEFWYNSKSLGPKRGLR